MPRATRSKIVPTCQYSVPGKAKPQTLAEDQRPSIASQWSKLIPAAPDSQLFSGGPHKKTSKSRPGEAFPGPLRFGAN